MTRLSLTTLIASLLALGAGTALAQNDYTVLHHFGGRPDDGARPFGALISEGDTLYGMTPYGGSEGADPGNGVVFSLSSDGSGYTILHNFDGAFTDGARPFGTLLSDGTALYGMTYEGGAVDLGTRFSMDFDGTYRYSRFFPIEGDRGAYPADSLVSDGTRHYGMTTFGGAEDLGIVFSTNPEGLDFDVLHDFGGPAADPSDGAEPWGDPLVSGGRIYGMTQFGGWRNLGVIYSMSADGSDYSILHHFAGDSGDGSRPFGSLVRQGDTLYGVTAYGGPYCGGAGCYGSVFSIGADGSDYTVLHFFSGEDNDGAHPSDSIILHESRLYGTTYRGGPDNLGTVFAINTDGSGLTLLHTFSGGDGERPQSDLLLHDGRIYGTTIYGGDSNVGVIFSMELPPAYIDLTANKAVFAAADYISVTADVQRTPEPFYPYVRILMADGRILYYVRDRGFVVGETPYLDGGPFNPPAPILGYDVLGVSFSGIAAGDYILEGYATDRTGNILGTVDRETLTVN